MATKRIKKELISIQNNPPENCSVISLDGNDYQWEAKIIGPKDTPYEGGIFFINIKFPQAYPFKPPQCIVVTKVFHPNIDTDNGQICLEILCSQWSPAFTISKVLISILTILTDPDFDDYVSAQAASLYKKNQDQFKAKAKEWTDKYAQ